MANLLWMIKKFIIVCRWCGRSALNRINEIDQHTEESEETQHISSVLLELTTIINKLVQNNSKFSSTIRLLTNCLELFRVSNETFLLSFTKKVTKLQLFSFRLQCSCGDDCCPLFPISNRQSDVLRAKDIGFQNTCTKFRCTYCAFSNLFQNFICSLHWNKHDRNITYSTIVIQKFLSFYPLKQKKL